MQQSVEGSAASPVESEGEAIEPAAGDVGEREATDQSVGRGEPLGPVGESERILSLDVLRGFAIFGILCMNIQWFAMTQFDAIYGPEESDWLDTVCDLAVLTFVNLKFVTLFSLMFGMGLVLQMGRAKKAGRPFAWTYTRRLLVLAGFGLVHAFGLWWGDILFMYSMVGFVLLLLGRLRAGVLVAIAGVCMLLMMTCIGAPVAIYALSEHSQNDGAEVDEYAPPDDGWEYDVEPDAAGSTDDPRWLVALRESMGDISYPSWSEAEQIAYGEGPMTATLAVRAVTFLRDILVKCLLGGFFWHVTALFLLGAALMKWGVFSPRRRRVQVKLCIIGIGLGLPLEVLYVWLDWYSDFNLLWLWYGIRVVHDFAAILLALGYAGGICLLVSSGIARRVTDAVACVGRLALTNYIGQSVIATAIFYWWGLGLFGEVSRAGQLGLVLAICLAQVVMSVIWLRWFRFGPLEWLWRSLTYGRRQPMSRQHNG